jgi:hypothetical protein
MNRALLCAALTVAFHPLGAQQTRAPRNWSIFVATGWMASSGGGSGTLMGERIPALYGLRFRLEEGPWWLGVEVDAWTARATAAGRDTIVARSRSNFGAHSGRASFSATTLAFIARRDLWSAGHADAYAVGSLGGTMAHGRIVGKCGTNSAGFPVCTDPPLDIRGEGLSIAASAGLGASYSYSHFLHPIPKWISWVLGDRVMVEGKLNSQSATEGRFTSGVVHLGIGW